MVNQSGRIKKPPFLWRLKRAWMVFRGLPLPPDTVRREWSGGAKALEMAFGRNKKPLSGYGYRGDEPIRFPHARDERDATP